MTFKRIENRRKFRVRDRHFYVSNKGFIVRVVKYNADYAGRHYDPQYEGKMMSCGIIFDRLGKSQHPVVGDLMYEIPVDYLHGLLKSYRADEVDDLCIQFADVKEHGCSYWGTIRRDELKRLVYNLV